MFALTLRRSQGPGFVAVRHNSFAVQHQEIMRSDVTNDVIAKAGKSKAASRQYACDHRRGAPRARSYFDVALEFIRF
jgi:hypothetical protein